MDVIPFWAVLIAGVAVASLAASAAAIAIVTFKDELKERRLKRLEEESRFLRERLDQVEHEGREKDKKIRHLEQYVEHLTNQLADKERQIAELRRQIRPGTLQ